MNKAAAGASLAKRIVLAFTATEAEANTGRNSGRRHKIRDKDKVRQYYAKIQSLSKETIKRSL